MLPFPEFDRLSFLLFSYFKNDKVFIRPDSGLKPFTGTVITKEDIEDNLRDYHILKSTVDDDELILIAEYQDIKDEIKKMDILFMLFVLGVINLIFLKSMELLQYLIK